MPYTDMHVNGPAVFNLSINGSTYDRLGLASRGVDIRLNSHHEQIQSDALPVVDDVQYLGQTARITAELTTFDESMMSYVRRWIRGGVQGTTGPLDAGTLIRRGNQYYGIFIERSQRTGLSAEQPWRFPCVYPVDAIDFRLGTIVTRVTVIFEAITLPSTSDVVAANHVLYTRA